MTLQALIFDIRIFKPIKSSSYQTQNKGATLS